MNECPALVSKLLKPKVIWYQTDANVILRIMLIDAQDYFLLVDEDHLRFSTTIKDRSYYLCLYLFGAIVPEKCTHCNVHREIKITLPKAHKWTSWMRLCLDKRNYPYIVSDPDKFQDKIVLRKFIKKDWDDLQKYKLENNIFNVPPATPSSDEAESDDEMMDALFSCGDDFY